MLLADHNSLSPFKFKVFELSTGNKKLETWTIPTKNWPYNFPNMEYAKTIFDEAFVLITIYEVGNRFQPNWIEHELREFYLILNLVTRKPYWADPQEIEEKIFTMVNDSLDQGEEPYHLSQDTINQSEIVEIKVRPGEIQLKSHIEMGHDGHNGDGDFLLIG